MKVLAIPFLAIMVAMTFATGPAQAQLMATPTQDTWAVPAQAGEQPLTQLERTGIPPFSNFGNQSTFFYDGNNRYLRGRWAGGGPGVGGDSGLSVLGQFP